MENRREWIIYNELLAALGKYRCGKHEMLRRKIKELFPQFAEETKP